MGFGKVGGGIILLLLLVSLVWIFFLRPTQITNAPLTKLRKDVVIVAFGDSLVLGVGAKERGKNFVDQLSNRIQLPIYNFGVSGNTTAQALSRIQEPLSKNPDIAIVLIGGNDALQKIPTQETFANIRSIVEHFHSRDTIVLLVGVQSGIFRDRYQEEFVTISREYNTLFVPDILDGLIGDSRYMSDAVHPNEAGYTIITDKLFPVINKVLVDLK